MYNFSEVVRVTKGMNKPLSALGQARTQSPLLAILACDIRLKLMSHCLQYCYCFSLSLRLTQRRVYLQRHESPLNNQHVTLSYITVIRYHHEYPGY